MKLKILIASAIIMSSFVSSAQEFSISTNLLGYAELGTMNAEASYALSRHWGLIASVRYNPFTFNEGRADEQFQLRQQSYSLGVRMWPWHIWSGWWFASKLRYQEYNSGGIVDPHTQEGDRLGAGLYAGYTHMIDQHWNIEFGLGLWTGLDVYRRYSCPFCGTITESGRKVFLLPDDIMLSLVYVF